MRLKLREPNVLKDQTIFHFKNAAERRKGEPSKQVVVKYLPYLNFSKDYPYNSTKRGWEK